MLTQEKLKEFLDYDPETGVFTNLKKRANLQINEVVGWVSGVGKAKEYKICLEGISYAASRLAFLYMTGIIPKIVDHKDTNRLNNKWENLREADYSLNALNRSRSSNNTTGIKGVYIVYRRGIPRYRARFRMLDKETNTIKNICKDFSLNMFDTEEKALLAADDWLQRMREKYQKEFANHG